MGKAAIFVDIENMGTRKVHQAVLRVIDEYSPEVMEIVLAADIPKVFQNDSIQWAIVRCAPGKDSADKTIIQRILDVLDQCKGIDRIILVTSDLGFKSICSFILESQINLTLITFSTSKLLKKVHDKTYDKYLTYIYVDQSYKSIRSFIPYIPTCDHTIFFRDRNGELKEIPFCNGIKTCEFSVILKKYGLHRKGWVKELPSMFLLEVNHRIYINEIAIKKSQTPQSSTIFVINPIFHSLLEIPFQNGIHMSQFAFTLKEYGLWEKNKALRHKWLKQMYLYFNPVDHRVYILPEDQLAHAG